MSVCVCVCVGWLVCLLGRQCVVLTASRTATRVRWERKLVADKFYSSTDHSTTAKVLTHCWLTFGREAANCDGVSVCLSVCLFTLITRKPRDQTSPICLHCMLTVAVDRSSSDSIVIRYVFPVLWITSRFHTMALWRFVSAILSGEGIAWQPKPVHWFQPNSARQLENCPQLMIEVILITLTALTLNLDSWLWSLTLNPRRAMVMTHTRAKGQRSKVTWFRSQSGNGNTDRQTDGRTDGQTEAIALPLHVHFTPHIVDLNRWRISK